MAASEGKSTSDCLLIIAPGGRDAGVIAQMLSAGGLACEVDPSGAALAYAMRGGGWGGAILTEEGLSRIGQAALRREIEAQPPWSDFPLILLSRRGETLRQGSRSIEDLGNVTILERPLHPATLVSAARSALRARRRQRMAEAHLRELERAEAQLRDLAETLEQKVVERTRELAETNVRLTAEIAERQQTEAKLVQAQKMEAVGQLTGGIAHDFNNLLTAVIGSLDLLLRRADDDRVGYLARNALQAAERGAQLTAQLLAFSRRQRLAPAPVDANAVITRMSAMLARSIGSHIELENELQPGLWAALADPSQLEVMILNLAINARDAMPTGGRLTIRTRNVARRPERLASDIAEGAYVAVSVRDSGIGMTPEVMAQAFEPFFTTKEQGKGTGLGLSQVYGFARQSGGSVILESETGKGTEVSIYLPRSRARPGVEARFEPRALARGNASILLVDDDHDVRGAAADMLQELGYEVVAVDAAAGALDAMQDRDFDLLLTDVAMPGMNGVELAREARRRSPRMPVLFASGYADLEAFDTMLSDEDLVTKPYRVTEIARRVAEALDGAGRTRRRMDTPAADAAEPRPN